MTQIFTILAGSLATLLWRILGVGIARRINTNHWLYDWFSHVSYASVAAILVQNLVGIDPSLNDPELPVRLIALLCGLLYCRMRAERVFVGLLIALGVYMLLDYTQVIALL